MSRKLDNNYFPLQMACAQQEYIDSLKVNYPSEEKLLSAFLDCDSISKTSNYGFTQIASQVVKNGGQDFFKKAYFDHPCYKQAEDALFVKGALLQEIGEFKDEEKVRNLTEEVTVNMKVATREILKALIYKRWNKNKQTYVIDSKMLSEFIYQDEVLLFEDAWDSLPYKTFCFDLGGDDENIVHKMYLLVTIDKIPSDTVNKKVFGKINSTKNLGFENRIPAKDVYMVSYIACFEDELFSNTFQTGILGKEIMDLLKANGKLHHLLKTGSASYFFVNNINATIDSKEIAVEQEGNELVIQILNYLVSKKPDVSLDVEVNKFYHKPNPKSQPKNVAHEIQMWNIGARYGQAIREYEKQRQSSIYTGTGSNKRPHSRRGHWSRYWYGKKDGSEKRICKPVWLNPVLVNIDFSSKGIDGKTIIEGDLVVHEMK